MRELFALRLRPQERRAAAALGVAAAALYGGLASLLGVAGVAYCAFDPDACDLVWAPMLLAASAALGWAAWRCVRACWRYLRTGDGGRAAWRWFVLAWVIALLWGVTAGAFPAIAQLLYTPMIVAGLAAALLAWRLISRSRRAGPLRDTEG